MNNYLKDDNMDIDEEYIDYLNNKYIVHRKFKNKDYVFGICDSLSDAIELRDTIDDDGWPLNKNSQELSDVLMESEEKVNNKEYYIKKFIDNGIIVLDTPITSSCPNLNKIYKEFEKFIKNENISILNNSFKYYFPRMVDKNIIKSEVINNETKYNITFKNGKTLNRSDNVNSNVNSVIKGKMVDLRVNDFIKKEIIINKEKVNENDVTFDDLFLKFNSYLKKFNEKISKNSFGMYFSKNFRKYKNADQLLINGKTRYNISFENKNSSDNTTNHNVNSKENTMIKGKIVDSRVNDFIKKEITINKEKVNENDATFEDIFLKFNSYLKNFNEKTSKTSFRYYFSKNFRRYKNADQLFINGYTRYNVSFGKKNQSDTPIKQNLDSKKKYEVNEKPSLLLDTTTNVISGTTLLILKGKIHFSRYSDLMQLVLSLKDNILSINIERKNKCLNFLIKIIASNSKNDAIFLTIKEFERRD